MKNHPGPAFEHQLEKGARARLAELGKAPGKLKDKVKECDLRSLDSIREEATMHLGNVYYGEVRLKHLRDPEAIDELTEIVRLARERHTELMKTAGRLMEAQRRNEQPK